MAQFSGGKDNNFSPKFTNFHTFIAKFYMPVPLPRGDMQKNAIFTGKQISPKREDAHYPFPGNTAIGIPEKRNHTSDQIKLKKFR